MVVIIERSCFPEFLSLIRKSFPLATLRKCLLDLLTQNSANITDERSKALNLLFIITCLSTSKC